MGELTSRRLAAVAAGLVLLIAAGVSYAVRGSPDAPTAAPAVSIDGAGTPSAARAGGSDARERSSGDAPRLYVHVAGAVHRPGVYRVLRGARADVALRRAGGATARADLTQVNLAAAVADGQQIVVPKVGDSPAAHAGSAAGVGGAAPEGPVSLSRATLEELDQLDGIGPKLAGRIVEYRKVHNGFRSPDELREVEGIGPKRFESLSKAVDP
jgi:competence protein ComEA